MISLAVTFREVEVMKLIIPSEAPQIDVGKRAYQLSVLVRIKTMPQRNARRSSATAEKQRVHGLYNNNNNNNNNNMRFL